MHMGINCIVYIGKLCIRKSLFSSWKSLCIYSLWRQFIVFERAPRCWIDCFPLSLDRSDNWIQSLKHSESVKHKFNVHYTMSWRLIFSSHYCIFATRKISLHFTELNLEPAAHKCIHNEIMIKVNRVDDWSA